MTASPPYSIIDTIARLRASGGTAWGDAAASVGKSLGTGVEKGAEKAAESKRADATTQAAKYHDATMFADKNFDWQHSPQAGGAPGGAPSGILQPANVAAAPGGAPPPPPPGAVPRQPGSVTMNDLYLAHGLKPVANGDQLIGMPKAQQKSEAAQVIEAMKTGSAEKIAQGKEKSTADIEKDKADAKSDATHMEIDEKLGKLLGLPPGTYPTDFVKAQVGATQRKSTGETAAKAKTDAASTAAEAKKSIADINARLKSPEHAIQLQAMKDRDAYITKNPTSSKLFGVPADIGKVPAGGAPIGSHPDDALIDKMLGEQ